MLTKRNDTATEAILILAESLRIEQAEELRDAFVALLEGPQPLVTLDLEAVESVDLTFFQLALALGKALEAKGRHLIVRTLRPDHPAAETGRLLGLPIAHHFTQVEASR
jgi:anti-anti-sigma regulatory factor